MTAAVPIAGRAAVAGASASVTATRPAGGAIAGTAAGALVVAARLWTARGRNIYSIWPDEPGQLAIARYLGGGGVRWNMYNHSTWRPGYGTLLSPVYWFTDDPTTAFRAGMVLNALLGGITAVLLYLLARRISPLRPIPAAAAAILVSLAPGLVFTTEFVWSESLVQPLALGTLLALMRFWDRPSVASGSVAGALAMAAFGTHSRMLPLGVVLVGVVAVACWRGRLPGAHAAVVVGWTAACFVAVSWYSEWIVDRLWERPFERNSYGGVLSQLGKIDAVSVSLLGQGWYQLVTSGGLVGVGAAAAVRAARRRSGATPVTTADARILLACVATLVALSALFMSDRWRSDQIVYGRYNDAAMAPLVLLGVTRLVSGPLARVLGALAASAALTLAAGAALNVLRHDELAARDAVRQMILGLLAFMGRPQSIDVMPITAGALAVVAFVGALTALARVGGVPTAALGAVAALVVIGYVRADHIVDRNRNGWGVVASVRSLQEQVLADGTAVRYMLPAGSNDTGRMMAYQFFLPENRFDVVQRPDLGDPETPFVFGPADDAGLRDAGAAVVWRDPGKPIALWELPGSPSQQRAGGGALSPGDRPPP